MTVLGFPGNQIRIAETADRIDGWNLIAFDVGLDKYGYIAPQRDALASSGSLLIAPPADDGWRTPLVSLTASEEESRALVRADAIELVSESTDPSLTAYGHELPRIIEHRVLTAAAGAQTFTLPARFRNMRIEYVARDTSTGNLNTLGMRCNGDDGNNYDHVRDVGVGVAASADSGAGVSMMRVGLCVGGGAPTGAAAAGVIHLPNYQGTTFHKEALASSGATDGDITHHMVGNWASRWRNTNAVSSVTLYANLGASNFAAGSVFTVYGN